MKRVLVDSSIKNMCFYIFLSLIMLYYAFRRSMFDYNIFNFSLYLSVPFLLLKFILEDSYTLKEILVSVVLIAFGTISIVYSGSTSILISFCVVIGMKNIDYIKALKIVFYIRLITVAMIVLSSVIGIIPNNAVERSTDGDIVRYALGFTHPNVFGVYSFTLISLWFILYGKKWKLKLILSMLLNVVQFLITNSRTSFMLINLYLFMILVVKLYNRKKFLKITEKIAMLSMPIGLAVSLLMPQLLLLSIGPKLNALFSSRLSLSEGYLRVYGIKPFGQRILVVTGDSYWALDSGFLNLFIRFGSIVGIICMILFFITTKVKLKNQYFYVTFIMFALYGIVEDFLTSMLFNYLWVIIGAAYYYTLNKKKKSKTDDILEKLMIKENKL